MGSLPKKTSCMSGKLTDVKQDKCTMADTF